MSTPARCRSPPRPLSRYAGDQPPLGWLVCSVLNVRRAVPFILGGSLDGRGSSAVPALTRAAPAQRPPEFYDIRLSRRCTRCREVLRPRRYMRFMVMICIQALEVNTEMR